MRVRFSTRSLRDARQSLGWSQKVLAKKVGIDPQAVKRLEAGVGSASLLVAAMTALDFHLAGIGPGRSLADQLRSRRQRLGLSVVATAEKSGLSRATIASLERGGGSVRSFMRLLVVLAPNARQRAKERNYWGQGDKLDRDSRFTPPDFMEHVYAAFGPIDLDPCAHAQSSVVAHRRIMLSEGGDGLVDDWSGRVVFMNPPFSELLTWLRRAHDQWIQGHVETVVCLVPVRTDSAWFQQTLSLVACTYMLQGRVRFLDTNGRAQPTPFSLMVLTLGVTRGQRVRFAQRVPGYWMMRSDD